MIYSHLEEVPEAAVIADDLVDIAESKASLNFDARRGLYDDFNGVLKQIIEKLEEKQPKADLDDEGTVQTVAERVATLATDTIEDAIADLVKAKTGDNGDASEIEDEDEDDSVETAIGRIQAAIETAVKVAVEEHFED